MLISEWLKKLQKYTQKSYRETNLMNMSKRGKSTFFHHIFVNKFLCVNFLHLLNSFEISIKFCVFDIFLIFSKINFLGSFSTESHFLQTFELIGPDIKSAQNQGKPFFINMS